MPVRTPALGLPVSAMSPPPTNVNVAGFGSGSGGSSAAARTGAGDSPVLRRCAAAAPPRSQHDCEVDEEQHDASLNRRLRRSRAYSFG